MDLFLKIDTYAKKLKNIHFCYIKIEYKIQILHFFFDIKSI